MTLVLEKVPEQLLLLSEILLVLEQAALKWLLLPRSSDSRAFNSQRSRNSSRGGWLLWNNPSVLCEHVLFSMDRIETPASHRGRSKKKNEVTSHEPCVNIG